MNDNFYCVTGYFTDELKAVLYNTDRQTRERIQEIRVRADMPLSLTVRGDTHYLKRNGELTARPESGVVVSADDVAVMFENICEHSQYSYNHQINSGFITIAGGNRVGICGRAVMTDDRITGLRDISSLNFRIARQVIGAADELMPYVLQKGQVYGTLIVSPPCGGKTTMLRDVARQLSGKRKKVCIIDERCEIAAMYGGAVVNDLGVNSDVLNGYSKSQGIVRATRALFPDVIICDEIGSDEDIAGIIAGLNAGVSFICSAHAGDIEQLLRRKNMRTLLGSQAIYNVVLLDGAANPCHILHVYRAEEIISEDSELINRVCQLLDAGN